MTPLADAPEPAATLPIIIPRAEHGISRKQIDEETLKVMYRLHRNGYKAYLVGGGVRDLLLGRRPKDFDVGTDATPDQVKSLFRNCFLVGRRFRLAHVRFGRDKVVEVATFRRKAEAGDLPENPEDHFAFQENVFGTPREDAFRRDFTINALFYDIESFSIIDYVGGLEDLAARRLRVIGNPLERFTEDPVRMLRALEFCARLEFSLDDEVRQGIYSCAQLIAEAAPARIREELLGLSRHAVIGAVLRNAAAMGLLEPLLGGYQGDEDSFALLERLDRRTRESGPPPEPFLLAALYLSRFLRACPPSREAPVTEVVRLAGLVLAPHCGYFSIARAISHQARELLLGVYRLARGRRQRGERRLLTHPMTPWSLELLACWSEVTGDYRDLVSNWRDALSGKEAPAKAPADAAPKRRRRPRRRKPRGDKQPSA
ncbi:polynucleotide adenylyltransferase PcnB [Geoalkalibacter sp.]|uniref:polynucleotide adenylyltransferase PcnB n=1 Tax=Geoalkalibacter sp. TaxID=3041440 RepID=UPI00272E3263|nr:polynucleotide adenylyltransferase PcnB [Geoalkalibacter sp.]